MVGAAVCRQYRRNMMLAALCCLSAYTGAAVAQTLGAVGPPASTHALSGINNITMPFFGIPLTVLAMAATGALIGAGYTDPVESRKKLYLLTISNTLFAAWFVVLIPEWRGWEITEVAKPPLAGVLAALNCVLIPTIFKRAPAWFTGILDRWTGKMNAPAAPKPPKEGE